MKQASMKSWRLHSPQLPAAWALKLQTLAGRWRAAWSQLAVRERKLVAACACLVVATVCWLVAIEPALASIRYWQNELPRLRSQAVAVESVVREAVPGGPVPADPALLGAALALSLDGAQLSGYELTRIASASNAPAGWQLTLTKVPAQALIPWLLAAPQQLHLAPTDVTLLRTGPAGGGAASSATVSGTVRLVSTADVKEIP